MENRRVQQYGQTGRLSSSIGFRWGEKENGTRNRWRQASKLNCRSLLLGQHDDVAVSLSYFGGNENPHFRGVRQEPVLVRQLPV